MVRLDGKSLAQKRQQSFQERVMKLKKGAFARAPQLSVVLVGEDPASKVYVGHKERQCQEVGIDSQIIRLPLETQAVELKKQIENLNADPQVDGILVQLPLPEALSDFDPSLYIDAQKDVDGLTAANMGLMIKDKAFCEPCTPKGVVALLKNYGFETSGKKAAVVGRSQIVGWPMAWMLTRENATVTVCHSRTQDLKEILRESDIVVAAAGRPQFLDQSFFKEGAVVVDVGIHRNAEGKLVGDVNPEGFEEKNISFSPVPGGVGPMTVSQLLENVIEVCEQKQKESDDV